MEDKIIKSIDEITTDDLRMVNQFIQTFSKATPKFILSTITNDGTVQMYDGNKNKTVGVFQTNQKALCKNYCLMIYNGCSF